MNITSIKQQIKRIDRYSIFVDGRYSFSLSEGALLRVGLTSGQELTPQQLDEFKQLSADDKLYLRAMHYAALRPRSEWELRSYLQRKNAAEDFIDQTVERLLDLRLLSDANFADSFVRDRQLLKPTSKRKLTLELKKKRVSDEHITAALEANELDESDNLQKVIAKKIRQSKYQDSTKLMQYLARQGFSYGDIKSALSSDDTYVTQ